jgi:hypothetical protein
MTFSVGLDQVDRAGSRPSTVGLVITFEGRIGSHQSTTRHDQWDRGSDTPMGEAFIALLSAAGYRAR